MGFTLKVHPEGHEAIPEEETPARETAEEGREEAARAHAVRLRKARRMIALIVFGNLLVLGAIIYLLVDVLSKPRQPVQIPNTRPDTVGEGQPPPTRRPVAYVTPEGSALRELEKKLVEQGLYCTIERIEPSPEAIEMGLAKAISWDTAQLRAQIEADAVTVMSRVLAECPNVNRVSVEVRSRIEGESGMAWATVFRLAASRQEIEKALKLKEPRQIVQALNSTFHEKLQGN